MTIFRLWKTAFPQAEFLRLCAFLPASSQGIIGVITNNAPEKLWKCTIARKEKLWYDRHILVGLLYSTTIDPAC